MSHRRGSPSEPVVSVVIASYRWPGALRLAIESALNQTVEGVEVIVVEDGLDTASREVVREIGDPRVRWVRKWIRSGSQTGPNQKGRRLARAPVVAYLGHDDIWAPDHLEGLLEALDTGADLVHSTTLMLGAPEGDRIAGSRPFTPDHFVPPSSMAHLRDSPRIGRWPISASITPQVDWHFFNSAYEGGATIAISGRPTTLKYSAIKDPEAFRRRDSSRQESLVRRFALDPEINMKLEAELLAKGVSPILAGDPGEAPRPSEAGGWGRRQKGFHGRFGLRSYRWSADAPEHFPGWSELRLDRGGRPFREPEGEDSAWVRFDTPRRPWAVLNVEAHISEETDVNAWSITIDGRQLPTRVSLEPGATVRLHASHRLWRRGRAKVIDVGITASDPTAPFLGIYRIWLGRWPDGSDRHSRLWPVRLAAIQLLRSRFTGR